MTDKTPPKTDIDENLTDFVNQISAKYQSDDNADISYTTTQLVEKFTNAYLYPPDVDLLIRIMKDNGFKMAIVENDNDFEMKWLFTLITN